MGRPTARSSPLGASYDSRHLYKRAGRRAADPPALSAFASPVTGPVIAGRAVLDEQTRPPLTGRIIATQSDTGVGHVSNNSQSVSQPEPIIEQSVLSPSKDLAQHFEQLETLTSSKSDGGDESYKLQIWGDYFF